MQFQSAASKTGSTPTSTHQKFHGLCICRCVNEHRPWLLQQASESNQHQTLSCSVVSRTAAHDYFKITSELPDPVALGLLSIFVKGGLK